MANPSRRKKPSIRDEAIDVNELAGMSNMKGMLSFLDTKPEDYAKLFAHVADFPTLDNETGAPDSAHNHQKSDGLLLTGAHITGAPDIEAPDIEMGSSTSGALVLITGAPNIGAPVLETEAPQTSAPILEAGALESGAPVLETEVLEIGAPVSKTEATETGAPPIHPSLEPAETEAPITRAPLTETEARITEAPAVESGAPETGAPDLASYRHVVVRSPRPWVNVQDGLSHGEERTYRAIFTHGKPYGLNGARALCIGDRQLASLAGLSYSNTHASVRTLAEKLAIEIQAAPHRNAGKMLIAFPYGEILRRWRAAGLTHVLKLSRGVWLKTGAPVSGAPVSGAPVSKTDAPVPAALDAETSAPVLGETGALIPGAHIRNKKEIDITSTTSATPASPLVASAILQVLGFVDDDAIQTLIRNCRKVAPDATDEEIAELGAMTARRLTRMRNVQNHIGLLITQTAKCFLGEPFAIYRREKAERERRFAQYQEEEEREGKNTNNY